MTFSPPAPAASADPAAWLTSRIARDGHWVTRTVGSGYEAYARILHPLDDGPDAPRWADVAAQHGRSMHPSAQWEHISSSVAPHDPMSRGDRGFPGSPDIGNLHEEALAALCTLLSDHTMTSDECWFAVWDGWGWQGARTAVLFARDGNNGPLIREAAAEKQLDLSASKFSLPARDYYLFAGPVDAATRIGHWVTDDWFDPQSPSIFWPADHAWCVATEIDFDSTLVAGSRELIAAITSSPHLEALPIAPDAPYQDLINS
jgi:hypothetical protein